MSGHGDPHDEAHDDGHDDHDDHHAPPPLPEPATPLWLTLLGIGLFLAGGIFFVATRDAGKTTAELTAEGQAADGAEPTAEQPAGDAQPNPQRPAGGSKQPGHEGHDHD